MSGKVVGWAFDSTEKLTPTERYVLVAISDNADQQGKCWPDRQTIIDKTGLSKSSVYRAFTRLKEVGAIEEGEDEKGRHQILVLVPWRPDSHVGNVPQGESESQGETEIPTQGLPYIEEPSEEPSPTDVELVFGHWQKLYAPRAKFDKKRQKRIKARLDEKFSVDDLCLAITNAESDDWLAGRRDGSPGYLNNLDTLLRDAQQVERLMALRGGGQVPSVRSDVIADKKALVRRGFQLSDDREVATKAQEAEAWLKEHGIETLRKPDGYPYWGSAES